MGNHADLVKDMLHGSSDALSKLITRVEGESPDVPGIIKSIYPSLGKAYIVGITGLPGAGKSTVVDRLITIARGQGLNVGVIGVDPTSPFSGGAVLGDRARMQQHFSDPGVYIRSMASRGSRGGLPAAAKKVIKMLDAFGKDLIMVETVGVGQTELDIIDSVDTTMVVLSPESGDSVQFMKAGLMEIGNLFVVNKADREGADRLIVELESMLQMGASRDGWLAPVLAAQAVNNVGIEEVYQQIKKHREFLESKGMLHDQRRRQRREEFLSTVERRFRERVLGLMEKSDTLKSISEQVERGEIDPYSAAETVEFEALSLKARS